MGRISQMRNSRFNKRLHPLTFVSVAFAIALFFALYSISKNLKEKKTDSSIVAGITKYPSDFSELPPFKLKTTSGMTFTNQTLMGRYTLLFFGYTHCPDICFATLEKIQNATAQLPTEKRPQVFFIALDEKYDSKEMVSKFIQTFTGINGVSAEQKDIKTISEALGIYAERQKESELIAHTEGIILIGKNGLPSAYLPASIPREQFSSIYLGLTTN
ncbi:MAG: SCO family protein [Methylacidiphilales bacterium]|nr:SCO family protein [Candidatus Methylacidiphilales bacterium]